MTFKQREPMSAGVRKLVCVVLAFPLVIGVFAPMIFLWSAIRF